MRTASYLSFLIFIAALFSRTAVQNYYSLSFLQEHGLSILFTSGSSFWYLNIVNGLFVLLLVMLCIESIKMHGWWAPFRIFFYSVLSIFMASITLIVLILIIAASILYIAYKIIKWFMSSRRRIKVDEANDDTNEKLNNTYRSFRAELYEWEKERKAIRPVKKEKRKKPVIKRSRKKIERDPSPLNDDFPRIHPD